MITDAQEKFLERQAELERRERIEHRDAILDLKVLLKDKHGVRLIKYLFKSLSVNTLPPPELRGEDLADYLGYLRAGNSIYKLACEAECNITGSIVAEIERGRYEELLEQQIFNNEINE